MTKSNNRHEDVIKITGKALGVSPVTGEKFLVKDTPDGFEFFKIVSFDGVVTKMSSEPDGDIVWSPIV